MVRAITQNQLSKDQLQGRRAHIVSPNTKRSACYCKGLLSGIPQAVESSRAVTKVMPAQRPDKIGGVADLCAPSSAHGKS